jgi:dTDP-4-dehydrorhamnose 3,5-epimerase
MQFEPLFLAGAWRIVAPVYTDSRGSFTRLFDRERFAEHGLETEFHQHAVSLSAKRGTVRGLHYQDAPHREAKLIRCTRGSLFDVMVDMRPESPTYLQHYSTTLDASSPTMLYIPAGFAHGFMTLAEDSEIEYHISQPYIENLQRGLRWNDPKLGIAWPLDMTVISPRDEAFALL